ncbi:ABC transporter permease [Catenulispora subtropica]|uniref:Oligopeptide transport system permease protein OppC n=2 Tax=Catenulispora subtropica TaxID=450798 RepID=A0ABP5ERE2_9ACTN
MTENPPPRDVNDESGRPDLGPTPGGRNAEFLGEQGQQPGLMIDAVTPGGEDILESREPTDREFGVKARSQWQLVLRRFLQHKLAVASVIVLLLVVLFAFVGAAVWHYSPTQFTDDFSVAPSAKHPFGTDSNGADHMAQVMAGTQLSLKIAFTVAILASVFGSIYGAVSGYYRGITDTLMMRLVDLFLTIPALAVGALLGKKFGSNWALLALVLAALLWTGSARVVRGQVLSVREKEFVEAARALGATDRRIIFRHILPNVAGPIIVLFTLLVATAVLTETALSYLGFGVQFPDISLGSLITAGETAATGGRGWLFYFPGLFIILIALTVNFIGDGLRDALDPTQTKVRA